MRFELGRTYRHSSGETMKVIGAVCSDIYGWCFVGEDMTGNLKPIGYADEGYAQNWKEVKHNDNQNS